MKLWLFLASFGLTLALVGHGFRPLPGTGAAASVPQQLRTSPIAAEQLPTLQQGNQAPVATSEPAEPLSSPGTTHDQFASLIETAIAGADQQSRGAAIAALSGAPAAEVLSTLEQVVRTDPDRNNRLLELDIMAQLADASQSRGTLLQLLQEFASDEDAYISAQASESLARLRAAPISRTES